MHDIMELDNQFVPSNMKKVDVEEVYDKLNVLFHNSSFYPPVTLLKFVLNNVISEEELDDYYNKIFSPELISEMGMDGIEYIQGCLKNYISDKNIDKAFVDLNRLHYFKYLIIYNPQIRFMFHMLLISNNFNSKDLGYTQNYHEGFFNVYYSRQFSKYKNEILNYK